MCTYLKFIFLMIFSFGLMVSCSKEETSPCVGHDPNALVGTWGYDSGYLGVDQNPQEQ